MITEKDGKIFFLGSGDYFGDKAVQADGEYVSKETCIIEEDTVCWRLKKTDIESVIGDIRRLGKPIPFTPKTFDSTLTINDIKRHKMLGMGKFLFIIFVVKRFCSLAFFGSTEPLEMPLNFLFSLNFHKFWVGFSLQNLDSARRNPPLVL